MWIARRNDEEIMRDCPELRSDDGPPLGHLGAADVQPPPEGLDATPISIVWINEWMD
jgi:hypothetical protein